MKELTGLIGVLLGGVLALLGGIIQRKLTHGDETRKIRREKLEEAHLLLNDLHNWCMDQMRGRAYLGTPARELPEANRRDCRICNISTLLRLYAPESLSQLESLEQAMELFRNGLWAFWKETYETGKKVAAQRYQELLVDPGKELETSRIQMKQAIEAKVHELMKIGT